MRPVGQRARRSKRLHARRKRYFLNELGLSENGRMFAVAYSNGFGRGFGHKKPFIHFLEDAVTNLVLGAKARTVENVRAVGEADKQTWEVGGVVQAYFCGGRSV